MSGCHCGQAGSMFCESCSDLRCKGLTEEQEESERQKEKEDWDKFKKKCEKEKKEFLNYLYSLYEKNN